MSATLEKQYVAAFFEGALVYPNGQQKELKLLLRILPIDAAPPKEEIERAGVIGAFDNPRPPNCYGVVLPTTLSDEPSAFVKGVYHEKVLRLRVEDILTRDTTYSLDLTWSSALILQGSGKETETSVAFKVVLQRIAQSTPFFDQEPHSKSEPLVHFLVGNAAPPPAFATVIPFNPIEWLLVQLPSDRIFGVGFMASSDVPSKPIILFWMSGDQSGGVLKLKKCYETYPQTQGYELLFHGVVVKNQLVGTWINEKGMSQGFFLAEPQFLPDDSTVDTPNHPTPCITFCRGCKSWKQLGTMMLHFSAADTGTEQASNSGDYFVHPETYDLNQTSALCFDCAFPPNVPVISLPPDDTQEIIGSATTDSVLGKNLLQISAIELYTRTPVAMFLRDKADPVAYGRLENAEFRSCDSTVPANGTSCASVVVDACNRFSQRTLLSVFESPELSPFTYTYGEIGATASKIIEMVHPKLVGNQVVTLLLSERCNTPLYFATTMACFSCNWIVVPVPAVMASKEEFMRDLVVDLRSSACIEPVSQIVLIDIQQESTEFKASRTVALEEGFEYIVLKEDLLGDKSSSSSYSDSQFLPYSKPRAPHEPAAVLFTSGTTNQASKGVIFNEELCRPTEGVSTLNPMVSLDFQSYEPTYVLSVLQTLRSGSSRFLVKAMDALSDPSSTVLAWQGGPTHIGAPPSFWSQLYRDYQDANHTGDEAAAKLLKKRLGWRLKVATSGGAGISEEVFSFCRDALELPLNTLYGSREAGGIARNGVVYPGVRVKVLLESSALATTGVGELVVHSPRMVHQYLTNTVNMVRDPTSDMEMLRTGDWGEVFVEGAETRIRVYGRRGNAMKSENGKWVDPSSTEGVIEEIPNIIQSAMFSDEGCVCCVAVVNTSGVHHEELARRITSHCLAAGVSIALTPTRFLVTHDRFTTENELMTASGKKRSAAIKTYFSTRRCDFFTLPQTSEDLAVVQLPKLIRHLLPDGLTKEVRGQILECEVERKILSASLQQLGLDSLLSVRLVNFLHEFHDGRIAIKPADMYQVTLNELALFFTSSQQSARRLSDTIRHRGLHDKSFWEEELQLPRDFLEGLVVPTSVPPKRTGVLLIGSTGFLGPYIAKELTQQCESVYLMGRSKIRMEKEQTLLGIDTEKVNYIEANFGENRLGLQPGDQQAVCGSVGTVILNAAMVNHASPYETLKEVNVTSSMEVVKFCLEKQMNLVIISSVAAEPSGEIRNSLLSFERVTAQDLVRKNGDPYGQTKAILESRAAHAFRKVLGAPKVVFIRPSLIGPASLIPSYRNENDLLTTLLEAAKVLGCRPAKANLDMHVVPVDLVASVVAQLLKNIDDGPTVQQFNLMQRGPRLDEIFAAFPSGELKVVSEAQFKSQMQRLCQEFVGDDTLVASMSLAQNFQFSGTMETGSLCIDSLLAALPTFRWTQSSKEKFWSKKSP